MSDRSGPADAPRAIHLRPYQVGAVAGIETRIAAGVRRLVLVLPTGGGKTTIAGSLILRAVARGQRVLFLAHRRELIVQAYLRLLDMGLRVEQVGIVMASDARRRPGAAVQVASIDTLRRRARPLAEIVFVDECHRALATSYREIAADYPDAIHLGLTATPYRADGKGLGDAYDELIVVATPRQLIGEAYLVEPRVFTVPPSQRPNLAGIRVARGDYAARELDDAMNRQALVGNIVEHWQRHAGGVRTVVFAVSIAHSRHITERFREAGVAAEHLDGATATQERDAILARLDRGETLVVSNCGVLCEGWDQPSVKCAVLARPTKSTGLYLQQAGRILRPWQEVPAVILDHAGCAHEHGLPQDDRDFSLEGTKRRRAPRDATAPVRECPACFLVSSLATRVCPACGEMLVASRDPPEEVAGDLVPAEDARAPPRDRAPSASRDAGLVEAMRAAARASGGGLRWELLDALRADR